MFSTIRQVPNNQEVYIDRDGFSSLNFDITERVSHLPTDSAALEYHFGDIIEEEDQKEIISVDEALALPLLPWVFTLLCQAPIPFIVFVCFLLSFDDILAST